MDSFELNKIIAAILLTALIVIGIGKFADVLFHVDKPKQSAYKIEGLDKLSLETNTKDVKVKEELNIGQLLAMGDVSHGEKIFKKCSACHMVASGGKNMIGPNLWGVVGRKTGSISDYKYSKSLAKPWSTYAC